MTGVKVFRFMTEFRFLEVLRGNSFLDRHRFKSFYWNTWLIIDKCIKLRTFFLEFIIHTPVFVKYSLNYSCYEGNQNLRESL